MDDLQLIYPSSHPFYAGIIIIGLGLSFIIGIYCVYRLFKTTNKTWKTILILLTIPLIGLPLVNFIGYGNHVNSTYEMYIGTYLGERYSSELQLLENKIWTSKELPLDCNSGTWELAITEDGTYIELFCEGSDNNIIQLWPSQNKTMIIVNEIELKKIKN